MSGLSGGIFSLRERTGRLLSADAPFDFFHQNLQRGYLLPWSYLRENRLPWPRERSKVNRTCILAAH